jgi:hypothetical protein
VICYALKQEQVNKSFLLHDHVVVDNTHKSVPQEKEGWLSEKVKDGWTRRYFVARADGSLACAKEPLHREKVDEVARVVANLRDLVVRDMPNHGQRYVFAVSVAHHRQAASTELLLAADSLREKKEWTEALASWSLPAPSARDRSPIASYKPSA